jgi:integrase
MTDSTSLTPRPDHIVERLGHAANQHAAARAFLDYRERQAVNTLVRQANDLASFAAFLATALGHAAPKGEALMNDAAAWQGITWGLVRAFTLWLLNEGYAIGTVNVRLTTIKRYASLAHQAGTLSDDEISLIKTVRGYSQKQAKRVNAERKTTRVGRKKAQPVRVTLEVARLLKAQPDTPQGRRDALLMCLLLDHGLRVSEVARMEAKHFDLKTGALEFYRPKVDLDQEHALTPDTLRAASAYLNIDAPADGPIFLGSMKNGELRASCMGERSITRRVQALGEALGVQGLSAHDCRHYWATNAARAGTDPLALQEAGGWSSLAMPRRYIERSKVANKNVKLKT